jgi:tetratricopeptide (TPR) repeat protein
MSLTLSLPAPDAPALNRRGIVRLMQGDPSGALDDFRGSAELDPLYAEAWNNSGLVRQTLGELDLAVADFDRALEVRPDYPEALTNRGRARLERGELAEAAADFDQALASAPARFAATVLHNRGALRQRAGDLAGALADFDRALEIDPEMVTTCVHRGTARKEAGDLTGARADLDHALERVAPHLRAAVYHKRGGVRVLQNDFAGAVADYDAALDLEPDNAIFYLSRGNARYHQRDVRAVVDYRVAFRLDPEVATREVVRIVMDNARRDPEGVLENCRKHLRISDRDAFAHARLGLTLAALGRQDEAAPHLARFQELVPDSKPYLGRLIPASRPL